jgi:hypothetical protein
MNFSQAVMEITIQAVMEIFSLPMMVIFSLPMMVIFSLPMMQIFSLPMMVNFQKQEEGEVEVEQGDGLVEQSAERLVNKGAWSALKIVLKEERQGVI